MKKPIEAGGLTDNDWSAIDTMFRQARKPLPEPGPKVIPDSKAIAKGPELIPTLNAHDFLTMQINSMTPLSPYRADKIQFDPGMPTHKRVYTQDSEGIMHYLANGGINPIPLRFAEFLLFKDTQANDFADALRKDVDSVLSIGGYADPETMQAYTAYEEGVIGRFDPKTHFVIRVKDQEVITISGIPHFIEDERPDVFPLQPEARYVVSPLNRNAIALLPPIMKYFHSHLRAE